MPPPAPASQPEIGALNRARDLAAQTEQGAARLVHSLDGNVYSCMSGLADSALDLEPAPRREHPNSHIAFAVSDAAGQRHAILRRVDLVESFNPPQLVFHQPEDGSPMKACRLPGVFVGLQAQHPFQVMCAGAGKWRVGGGKVSVYGEVLHDLPDQTIELQKGWICIKTKWTVVSANDYRLDGATIERVQNLNDNQQPRWDVNDDQVLVPSDGVVLHPIAYVASRGAERPLIQQSLNGDLAFQPLFFPWSLTGPRTSLA